MASIITDRKAREGNVFAGVCLSTGGVSSHFLSGPVFLPGGVSTYRVVSLQGVSLRGSLLSGQRTPQYWHPVTATAAISTYPVGTHSCELIYLSFTSLSSKFDYLKPQLGVHSLKGSRCQSELKKRGILQDNYEQIPEEIVRINKTLRRPSITIDVFLTLWKINLIPATPLLGIAPHKYFHHLGHNPEHPSSLPAVLYIKYKFLNN